MKLSKTALYDFHISRQGKMVQFSGYYLPAYNTSINDFGDHRIAMMCEIAKLVINKGKLKSKKLKSQTPKSIPNKITPIASDDVSSTNKRYFKNNQR